MAPDAPRPADPASYQLVPPAAVQDSPWPVTPAGQGGPPRPAGRARQPRWVFRRGRLAALVLLPAADLVALTAAAVICGAVSPAAAVYAAGVLVVIALTGQYRLRITLRTSEQAGRILAAAAVPGLLLLAPLALPWLAPSWPAPQRLAMLALWSAGLLLSCRAAGAAALRAARRRGLVAEAALVVGAGTLSAHLAELMRLHPELGLAPCGLLDDGAPRRDLPVPFLGRTSDLGDVVTRLRIRRVIISYADCKDEDLAALLRRCRSLRADACLVPRLYELGTALPRGCADEIWGIPLIPLRHLGPSAARLRAKRAFDATAAALLLALAAPVLLLLAAAIRLQSGEPALFRQVRVTGCGRQATILKLRTLTTRGDPDTCWTADGPEPGRLGRLLRVTHLDELPQLLNVLRGDMSLVGPRPERPYFADRFSREVPRYADRDRMPAGLTGWAQVHGLNGDISISERVRFDNQYIENWSPWLDAVILARTLAAAIPGRTGGGQ
ncbi:MAG: exopolysaccharide biosynthesis polyprenyl glycosylphosphotransferase [Streptosporangiaceae bacterium]|jgi:exopolysaccharide biosynthesis polyprenyl glycosylphosphotransferase|nr:UDP-phosphate galactose phosphotransferase [Actinomycetota bacterium]